MNIKETKEALIGLMELSIELGKVFKDGIQVTDAVTLYANLSANDDLKAKFVAAYDGVNLIPEEIKDLSASEAVELAVLMMSYVPKLLDSIKKESK